MKSDSERETPRVGRCALVGRPNVGKSTLLNTLVGQRLAIATPTPQTTRTCLLGVYTAEDPPTEIAFIDTPGLHDPKNALGRFLLEEAKGGLAGADVVVFLTDLVKPGSAKEEREDARALDIVRTVNLPIVLALNKVDRLKDKGALLPRIEHYAASKVFDAIVPLSAKSGANVDGLLREIRGHLPEGTLSEGDAVTDRSMRFFAAEFVREAAIRHTRQEVPHSIAVTIDEFDESGRSVHIAATVVVEKESHKKIVIGARGSLLKVIGTEAREAIEAMCERKVMLKLWVKVAEDWTNNPSAAKRLASEVESS